MSRDALAARVADVVGPPERGRRQPRARRPRRHRGTRCEGAGGAQRPRPGATRAARPRPPRAAVLRPHARTPPQPAEAGPDPLMLDALSKSFFHALAGSATLKSLATALRHALTRRLRPPFHRRRDGRGGHAGRPRAGRTRACCSRSISWARASRRWTRRRPPRPTTSRSSRPSQQAGIERNISLKLTQLGLDLDRAHTIDNLRRILDAATEARLLRADRHGELALHRADARDLRDGVEPRVHELRHRPAVGAASEREGPRPRERARRPRPAGQGRVQGTAGRGRSRPRPKWTRPSSA